MKKIVGIFLLTLSMSVHSSENATTKKLPSSSKETSDVERRKTAQQQAKKTAQELNERDTVIKWETRRLFNAFSCYIGIQAIVGMIAGPLVWSATNAVNNSAPLINNYLNATK